MVTVGEVVSISDQTIIVRCVVSAERSLKCSGCRSAGRCVNQRVGFGSRQSDDSGRRDDSSFRLSSIEDSGLVDHRQLELPLPQEPLRPGDRVRLEIPEQLGLRLAMTAYGLPVVLLLTGSLLARYIFLTDLDPDSASIIGGLAGFIGGLIAYKPLSMKLFQSSTVSACHQDRISGSAGSAISIKRL